MLVQRAVADSPRWTRAVGDQSAPIPENNEQNARPQKEKRLGRNQAALLARRPRTREPITLRYLGRYSVDARSERQPGYGLARAVGRRVSAVRWTGCEPIQ